MYKFSLEHLDVTWGVFLVIICFSFVFLMHIWVNSD